MDGDDTGFLLLFFCSGGLFCFGRVSVFWLRGNSRTFSGPPCSIWGKNENTGSLEGGFLGLLGDGAGFGGDGLEGLEGGVGFLCTGS